MTVTSLGFRTDIELRVKEGAEVTERDGYLVVRSRKAPLFRWGNFLLLREVSQEGTAALWTATFDREFPGADYVALGVDATDPAPPEKFTGFTSEIAEVMTAEALTPPAHPNQAAELRPVTTDADWEQSYRLTCACNPGANEFLRTRMNARRGLAEAGHGVWLGAFLDGELRAHLGIFDVGSSMARFQDVETHPDARRRGLAGTLVHAATSHAAARTLVIVADPHANAIRLYRSLGFTTAQRQLTLERYPR